MLRLCNSLTGKKEKFVPLVGNKVKIYVCGITPYDTTHLGHAFTYVFFDVLYRYLKFKGFKVNYTQNVTDIDDDILKKANEEKKDWKELGNFWTKKYLNDMKQLNVLPPTHFVKATGSIAKIVEIVKLLIDKKLAYQRDGNVYFDIGKFKNYGKLSRFNQSQMILLSKERGADPNDPNKKNPLDFLLWQRSKPGEPFWKTPWGNGRPGWHIECSAMINRFLGDQIDIHGGGRDLIFPHHESEIAQSEGFTDKKPFVKYWMHTSMVLYQGEKMSKSLGNLVMVSDLLKKYKTNEIRWYLLSHYYKKPWEFDEEELVQARNHLQNIKRAVKKTGNKEKINEFYIKKFTGILDNDMCTPEALDLIVHLAKKSFMSPTLLKLLPILGIEI
jgi:L-cysteine:1D-myo-inositol 2-amino-2-deoxy-alpha-D-glucopyranoside ligase